MQTKAVAVILIGVAVLVVVSCLFMYTSSCGSMETFQDSGAGSLGSGAAAAPSVVANIQRMAGKNTNEDEDGPTGNESPVLAQGTNHKANTEGFTSYSLSDAAGSKNSYTPMGAYDGVTLPTGNKISSWRYTAPNEKLLGKKFVPGPDSLFMFKNNQCKPECCGASFSCGGGCVCTTPEQRQYIAGRGGNRTKPEDSA